jgi:very-short-patch-repair endonuclease
LNFAPRALLVVVLVAAGFMLPFLWLGAAFVAFSLYAESRPFKAKEEDGRFPITTVDDPDWKSKMQECVESPAEEAFLSLMIEDFDLKPHGRALQGNDLTLRMQVEALRYRLDFLVDDALVVEIDGAQWHSSPEAVARDKKRDEELVEAGYTILRIPAKVALNDKERAVDLVKGMRLRAAEGRKQFNDARQSDLRHALKPTTLIKTAAEQASNAANFMDELTAEARRRFAEEKAREGDPAEIRSVMDEVHAVVAKINDEMHVLRTSQFTVFQGYAGKIDAALQSISEPAAAPETRSAALGQLNSVERVLEGVREMIKLEARNSKKPEF